MKKLVLLFVVALTLSGCMDRTKSRMGNIFEDSARDAGESLGDG
ncbi:MAG: hypothetical protein WBC26_06445 [Alphaproteobacteria bacterium]